MLPTLFQASDVVESYTTVEKFSVDEMRTLYDVAPLAAPQVKVTGNPTFVCPSAGPVRNGTAGGGTATVKPRAGEYSLGPLPLDAFTRQK